MIDKSSYFHVQIRKDIGKSAKKLNKLSFIPANVYGMGKPSQALQITDAEYRRMITGGHDSGLIYLVLDESQKPTPALVDEIALNPVTQVPQHLVFRRVDLKQEIETEVKVEMVGECEVVDATPVVVKDSIQIKAVPESIPDSIKVDISGFSQVGESITLSELVLPEGVSLAMGEDGSDEPLIVLQTTKVVEPVEEEKPDAGAPEAVAGADDEKPAENQPLADANEAKASAAPEK